MAAVCSTEKSICAHEPLKEMTRWQDVFSYWSDGKLPFTGVSDSAFGLHLGEILDKAAPRTLIIWRSIPEVEESLVRQGFQITNDYCDILARRLEPFREHPLVASVGFNKLKDPDVVVACLNHLMPGISIDMDRLDRMMDEVIQVDPYEVMISAVARSSDIRALLGGDVIDEMHWR
jgi:hypothetical protein